MEKYESYIEMADSEVRAIESYSNFQMFLDESIESAMESTGSFRESMNKMKDSIVKFFKMIFGAIQRFFIRIFGKGERLGHKKAIDKIREYSMLLKNRIEVAVNAISNIILKNEGGILSIQMLSSEVSSVLDHMENDVYDLINNSKDKHEYSLISKDKLNYIVEFTKKCESYVENILEVTTHNQNYSPHNNILIQKLLNEISKIESIIMKLTQSAMWEGRVEDNETKLKNPVTIEVED